MINTSDMSAPIFWKLKIFRKPCPVREKKIISTSRNSHDHPLLAISSGLKADFPGWLCFASGIAALDTFIDFSPCRWQEATGLLAS